MKKRVGLAGMPSSLMVVREAPPLSSLPSERDGLFRAVRQGLPLLATLGLVVLTFAAHRGKGWYLLGAVAVLAEVLPTFRRGAAYLRSRRATMRWDGLWVTAYRPVFRLLGRDEAWVLSFCAWNNRRVRGVFQQRRARKALVLLPHCIQLSTCRAEVTASLDTCYSCGRCTVQDVLEASLRSRWDVRLTNRSNKAYREARAFQPDLIVAVSCHDRLFKGLTRLPEIPSYVVPLALPHGMCVDTTFDTGHLMAAMTCLVEPRSAVEALQTRSDIA